MSVDYKISKAIGSIHTEFGDWLMPKITVLGNAGMIWIVVAAVFSSMPSFRERGIAMVVALFFSGILGNVILKPLIGRHRPFQTYSFSLLIAPPVGYSFPSGHTATSFAAALTLCWYDWLFGIIALILAILISFSRLYLFVHYFTDILGGIALGVLSAGLSLWLMHHYFIVVR